MNIAYILPRFIRHLLPDVVAKFLLERRFIIKPGVSTTNPKVAIDTYLLALKKHNYSIKDKKVLVFGYGGRFDVGCGLIEHGAKQVVLVDLFTYPDPKRNRVLLEQYPSLLRENDSFVVPSGEELILIQGDVLEKYIQEAIGKVDLVISNSVFEHIVKVERIVEVLAQLLLPEGAHYHNIDLRDHFFKYPFEMLTFKEKTWYRWLNPSSNHNRYRFADYKKAFEACFNEVSIEIVESSPKEFEEVKSRIRPEFLTGNDKIDAIGQISIFASTIKK